MTHKTESGLKQERGVVRVLKTSQRRAWQQMLESIGRFDFYHTADYHALGEMRDGSQAEMVVYAEGGALIAAPFLFRHIWPDRREVADRNLWDGRSVYGYVGWLASPNASAEMFSRFGQVLQVYLRARRVVSIFSRMHPLMDTRNLEPGIGTVENAGQTVAVDLRSGLAHYETSLAKGHRYEIRKLREQGCTVVWDRSLESLELFTEIYTQTMQRLGARPQYFFELSEFRKLFSSDQYEARLYIASLHGAAAAMSIVVRCGKVLQYHLSCSLDGITRYPATKLLLDHVIRNGIAEGQDWFHLGGGVGGKQDTLFNFKLGFGGQPRSFRVWKWVVRPDDYASLAAGALHAAGAYFPVYRYEQS